MCCGFPHCWSYMASQMSSRSDFIVMLCQEFRLSITCNSVIYCFFINVFSVLALSSIFHILYWCFITVFSKFFLSKNLSRWTAVLPWELTESQMIFIHIAIALHIPYLEITLPLCAIASLSLHALMSSKMQCWHLKYCHWHGWCLSEWGREFSPQWWFFWGSLQIQALVMVIFCISYTCSAFLRCIFELCFANINGTVLLIVVALSHVHPVSCPPAAPKDLCSTVDITLYCITAVKYDKKNHSRLARPLPATHKLSPRVHYKLG